MCGIPSRLLLRSNENPYHDKSKYVRHTSKDKTKKNVDYVHTKEKKKKVVHA